MSNWIRRITDRYTKDPNSNIGKLISMIEEEVNETLFQTNDRIVYYQDIENAEGAILDDYGRDVGQPRLSMDDESYLFMIITKDQADFSRGDIETINEMMDLLLSGDYIGLKETWTTDLYQEYAGIVLYYNSDRFFPRLRFDGTAKFDGSYIFQGNRPGEFETESHDYMKMAIGRIVEKGVKIYYAVPIEFYVSAYKKYDWHNLWKFSREYSVQTEYQFSQNINLSENNATGVFRFDGGSFFNGVHTFDGTRKHVSHSMEIEVK